MSRIHYTIVLILFSSQILGQSRVAITIDDVPSTKRYAKNNFNSKLLKDLDSLNIPVAIFINEGMIYETDSVTKNFDLLNQWISKAYVIAGTHTFSHSRYSEVGFEKYVADIEKGETISRELTETHNKDFKYFRFTYNDLGKDSIQQKEISDYLSQNNFTITPFTIESSDWMFSFVYDYHLRNNNIDEARRIGESYVETTLAYFQFFDSLTREKYGRRINQIYLCHDNSINADYFTILIEKLKELDYTFISLDEALKDPAYQQENTFYKSWGISWVYRWMNDQGERSRLMRNEPDIMNLYKEYQEIQKKK